MHAFWTRLHGLATSLMLAAMLSFVGHGIAMARVQQHGAGEGDHSAASAGLHMHGSVPHDHGRSTHTGASHDHGSHVHQADTTADLQSSIADAAGTDDPHATDSSKAACCGQACVSAIQVSAPEVIAAPMRRTERLQSRSQTGSGIDPNGFKRPPRTPDIG